MRGYADAQARQIFRDLIDMPADVTVSEKEVEVSFHRRAHLPILLASDLMGKRIAVPWWHGLSLRLTTYDGRQNTPHTQVIYCPWKSRLGGLVWQRVEATQPEVKSKKPSLLDTPVVLWTREEEETADRAMELFRNHDE